MRELKRVAKNTGILYIKMGVTIFISLYTTRLVLATLGLDDFGLFNVIGGAIALLGFLNASMSSATQRFMSFSLGAGKIQNIRVIFNMSILLHIIISFIILVILELAGYFFFNGILNIDPGRIYAAKIAYQFMIISTIFSVISVPYNALLNAHENMLFYAISGTIETLLKLVIAIAVAFINADKLIYYSFLMTLIPILILIIDRIYCLNKYPESRIDITGNFDRKTLKEMSGFAGWTLLGSSSSMIAQYGQGIVLNVFFGTRINAAQGIANQVSGQLGAFASTMLKALNPIIDKSEGAGNRRLMLNSAMLGSKISFFLLMFFFVPVLIEMPYIFSIWLKEVPEFAIIFCRLYLIRNLIDQMFVTLSSTIGAVGKIQKYQITTSILYILPLIITYILFKTGYPPYILYIVFILFALIMGSVNMIYSKKICDLSVFEYFNKVILRCVISFITVFVFASLPVLIFEAGIVRLVCIMVITVVSYFITIWYFGLSLEERKEIQYLFISVLNSKKIPYKRNYSQVLSFVNKQKQKF